MKISTKGRYGLSIMLELALCYNKNLLTTREIALQQEVSEKHIEQIIGVLTRAKLVHGQRGANGGYRLAEAPADVTVGKILRVTENGLNITDCARQYGEHCGRSNQCMTMSVWKDIEHAVANVVDQITLADLVLKHTQNYNFSYLI